MREVTEGDIALRVTFLSYFTHPPRSAGVLKNDLTGAKDEGRDMSKAPGERLLNHQGHGLHSTRRAVSREPSKAGQKLVPPGATL